MSNQFVNWSNMSQQDDSIVINSTVLIPPHVRNQLDNSGLGEERVLQVFSDIRDGLESYLDSDEALLLTYRGFDADFNGVGGGPYVFGATDRRFVLRDNNDNFEEISYDAVTEITGEPETFQFEARRKHSVNWRVGIVLFMLCAGSLIWSRIGPGGRVFAVVVFLISFLGVGWFLLYNGGKILKNRVGSGTSTNVSAGYRKIVIRTPSSTETETTVEAHVDHFTETANIDVSESTSERYILRQWLPAEEAANDPTDLGDIEETLDGVPFREYEPIANRKYGVAETFGGETYDEPDLEIRLSKIVRENR